METIVTCEHPSTVRAGPKSVSWRSKPKRCYPFSKFPGGRNVGRGALHVILAACTRHGNVLWWHSGNLQVKDNNLRVAELAAYFTHCKLQPVHALLSLNSAMKIFYKQKLYGMCATFCRRLLELQPPEKIGAQARQVRISSFTLRLLCILTFCTLLWGCRLRY